MNCFALKASIQQSKDDFESMRRTCELLVKDDHNKHRVAFKLIEVFTLKSMQQRIEHEKELKEKPFRFGTTHDDDAGWVHFWVFAPTFSNDHIRTILDQEEVNIDGWRANCAGQSFARAISIRRGQYRTLVTQSGGLDI